MLPARQIPRIPPQRRARHVRRRYNKLGDTRQIRRGLDGRRILDKYVEGWTVHLVIFLQSNLFWKTFNNIKNSILSINQLITILFWKTFENIK